MDAKTAIESLTSEIDHPALTERREIAALIQRQEKMLARAVAQISAGPCHDCPCENQCNTIGGTPAGQPCITTVLKWLQKEAEVEK